MGLSDVSAILWRERQLLELLLFKLEEEQLLLASGRVRFLAHATREVEVVLEEIKRVELARAVEVEAVAGDLGLDSSPSLQQLIAAAPDPWRGVFADHREAFLTATEEITEMARANRELLAGGQQAVGEALRWLGAGEDETYTPQGAKNGARSGSFLVDEAL